MRRTLAVLALGLPVVLLADPGAKPGLTEPRRERIEWGIYQIHWGRLFASKLAEELERFASEPDYVMFFRDLGRPYPQPAIDAIRARGGTPIVSMELWHWMGGRADDPLANIAKGKYDAFFTAWARAARADGKRVLLRFGFEMNGDWFSWGGRPKLFTDAWKRVHAIFRKEKADRVEWVWSPNVMSVPDKPENSMHHYYPGGGLVDWVALDGYNFGDHHDEWHEWESFESVYRTALPELERRYPEKRIMIAETGAPPGKNDQREKWIREAYAYLQGRPRIQALVWFNYDKRREKEPNWRIDATPGSLKAWNETFARAR